MLVGGLLSTALDADERRGVPVISHEADVRE
jgi:hypothetical protein